MLLELAKGHYASVEKNVPEVKVHNLYLADNPSSPSNYSYITRPSLSEVVAVGRRVRGMSYQQGWFSDQSLVVSGEYVHLYNGGTSFTYLGLVADDAAEVRFAYSSYLAIVLSAGIAYSVTTGGVTAVTVPVGVYFSDVCSLNGYIIFSERDSNRIYWIKPGESDVEALSYASAEANPDHLTGLLTTSDELWLYGETTTEVWSATGNTDAPFIRVSGRVFNTGCAFKGSIASAVKNSLPCSIWVSDTREVVLAQGAIARISDDYIEELLKEAIDCKGWYFRNNRNDFYVLSTTTHTVVYDLVKEVWYKWDSYLSTLWYATKGLQIGPTVYAVYIGGNNTIYRLENDFADTDTDQLICEVSGHVRHVNRRPVPCSTIDISLNAGFGSSYLTTPVIEMRWSDDGGSNWSPYMQTSVGLRGATDDIASFRSLGLITHPGRLFEFRFSSNDSFRLDYVSMNGLEND